MDYVVIFFMGLEEIEVEGRLMFDGYIYYEFEKILIYKYILFIVVILKLLCLFFVRM